VAEECVEGGAPHICDNTHTHKFAVSPLGKVKVYQFVKEMLFYND